MKTLNKRDGGSYFHAKLQKTARRNTIEQEFMQSHF